MGDNNAFNVGMFLGIFIVVVFGLLFRKKFSRGEVKKYDERQELIRGRAYKHGFKSMLITIILLLFAEFLFGRPFLDKWMYSLIIIIVGSSVFVVYTIVFDAYFYISMDRKKYITILMIAAVINLVCAVLMIISGGVITNGILTVKSINIFVTLMLLVVIAAINFRAKIDAQLAKREDED
ncbi:MAG: DUF6442 family protein [Peptostreptococcus sp.]|uniref:DUF6442 family protein n=1 Tax=Peptostreptococcus sp. TaxID=1262 RepID=UPI002FC83F49